MTIEQTLKDDERLSRKEACALIQKALRLEKSTVEKKTIYGQMIAGKLLNRLNPNRSHHAAIPPKYDAEPFLNTAVKIERRGESVNEICTHVPSKIN